MSIESKGERDFRVDFCRGLALIVIFIDHIPGNPIANFTLRNFGFCDAAEVFVLISGFSTYLAYASKLDRLGLAWCAPPGADCGADLELSAEISRHSAALPGAAGSGTLSVGLGQARLADRAVHFR